MINITTIKAVHTAIWVFFVTIIGYIVHAGWTGDIDLYTWIAVGLVCLEGLVLLWNKGRCPLTTLAEKHAQPERHNFDIYLPEWLARHNQAIFGAIFALGLALVVYRSLL